MTLLIVSVFGDSIDRLHREALQAVEHGADAVELRLDLMGGVSDAEIRSLRDHVTLPLVLTLRSEIEGGGWTGDDDKLVDRLVELSPIADFVDIELAVYRRSDVVRRNLQRILRRAGHVSQADGREEIALAAPRKLILSRHDPDSRPPTLNADLLEMLDLPVCEVPKIAYGARTVRDNFEAFELMRSSPRPIVAICMGEDGLLSRVLAKKFGAFASFAASPAGGETAPGQLAITTMKQLYRWNEIDSHTAVYGLIGDPVAHSLGPAVHNAAFASLGLNAVYLPMRVTPSYEAFKAFMVEVRARPWLDFRGLSVTLPHKENGLRFVRESGGTLDAAAERAGAINTIVMGADGKLAGFNTDLPAAMETICEGLKCRGSDLDGRPVAVLGAGGVARSVVAALTAVGARVTIYNRSTDRAQTLAEAFACGYRAWDQRLHGEASLIVNCTSIGMWPDTDASPLPVGALRPGMAVFDTVYNPAQTRLLREAGDQGCICIDGLGLFVRQAWMQSLLWTKREAAMAVFRNTAEQAIRGA